MDKYEKYPPFSVLMSLYSKEKAEFFDECMRSIEKQSIQPSEIVLVLDGPITSELENVLQTHLKICGDMMKIVRCSKNQGLGIALSIGVPECSNELIARMDTDDVAREDRFEKQLTFFNEHPEIDICGSNILEFEGTVNTIVSRRKVPLFHENIVKYQKTRSAFNHMTVMYKKSMVISSGNYHDVPLMEDDSLWVRMILNGAQCANIEDDLVYVRVDGGMFERRGGWNYFKKYKNARKSILQTGFISYWDYYITIVAQFFVSLLPSAIRRQIFLNLLRS